MTEPPFETIDAGDPMPPGNTCTKPPVKVIERVTVEACLAIARRVQLAQQRSGDVVGSEVASQVAQLITEELLHGPREKRDCY